MLGQADRLTSLLAANRDLCEAFPLAKLRPLAFRCLLCFAVAVAVAVVSASVTELGKWSCSVASRRPVPSVAYDGRSRDSTEAGGRPH
ncbi:unnamed protein product [Protopolystoma xenopodis]|uniref:Uncharacterized protein n=1 Tax=Protopolystoma xenopodis TaxID=117903 RepID=A0A3S5BP50_9PLAT|nr:unnamed protein product [Protopolystoma xenopodis]